jgi:predicted esterase
MTAADLGFVHRYVPPASEGLPTLLLLHGTGGDENNLVPLGQMLLPGAGLLSPRGKVLENGMPRFFRRLSEGVFDVEDVIFRAGELAEFVSHAAGTYGFDPAKVVAVGFSNGANIAAAMLVLHPESLPGAVLFHGQVPLVPDPLPDLQGRRVFLSGARLDTMVVPTETERLATLLRQAGCDLTLHWEQTGHNLTGTEVEAAHQWLSTVWTDGSAIH